MDAKILPNDSDRELLELALDALEGVTAYTALLDDFTMTAASEALEALRAALARPSAYCPDCGKRNAADLIHTCTPPGVAPDAEPVAWQITYTSADGSLETVVHGHNAIGDYRVIDPAATSTPLYAAPQPAPVERKPLNRRQVNQIVIDVCDVIYPQDEASYSAADEVFYGAFVHAIERAHGIKAAT